MPVVLPGADLNASLIPLNGIPDGGRDAAALAAWFAEDSSRLVSAKAETATPVSVAALAGHSVDTRAPCTLTATAEVEPGVPGFFAIAFEQTWRGFPVTVGVERDATRWRITAVRTVDGITPVEFLKAVK